MLYKLLKRVLLAVALVLTSPLWMAVRVCQQLFRSEALFVSVAQFMSLIPGMTGVFFRRAYYFMTLRSCASDVFIDFGTLFSHCDVTVGQGVYIGGRCTLGMCEIGDNTLIGSNVDILSGRHQHDMGDRDAPSAARQGTFTQIRIGRNAWIGNRSVLMADVGNASVVGAGSVVVKPIPPYSVAVGNPAVVKRSRSEISDDLVTPSNA